MAWKVLVGFFVVGTIAVAIAAALFVRHEQEAARRSERLGPGGYVGGFADARDVRGVVVDDDGRPVAGAGVQWAHESGPVLVRSDPDGRFVLPASGGTSVDVYGPEVEGGPEHLSVRVEAGTGEEELTVVLTGARTLRVRFLDAATRTPLPLTEWQVDCLRKGFLRDAADGTGTSGITARTECRHKLKKPGTYTVTVTCGKRPAVTIPDVEITDERETVIDVPLVSPR